MPLVHAISLWPCAARLPEPSGADVGEETCQRAPTQQGGLNPSSPRPCGCLALDAWQQLVFRFFLFGRSVCARAGRRPPSASARAQCAAAAARWQRSAGHGAPCCGGLLGCSGPFLSFDSRVFRCSPSAPPCFSAVLVRWKQKCPLTPSEQPLQGGCWPCPGGALGLACGGHGRREVCRTPGRRLCFHRLRGRCLAHTKGRAGRQSALVACHLFWMDVFES